MFICFFLVNKICCCIPTCIQHQYQKAKNKTIIASVNKTKCSTKTYAEEETRQRSDETSDVYWLQKSHSRSIAKASAVTACSIAPARSSSNAELVTVTPEIRAYHLGSSIDARRVTSIWMLTSPGGPMIRWRSDFYCLWADNKRERGRLIWESI